MTFRNNTVTKYRPRHDTNMTPGRFESKPSIYCNDHFTVTFTSARTPLARTQTLQLRAATARMLPDALTVVCFTVFPSVSDGHHCPL